MKAQFCPRCGHENPNDAKFCPACGSPRWVEGTDPLHATLLTGRYRLLDKIDESSVGPLYRAEDRELGRPVAVRLLDPALTLDEAALGQVRSEMQLMGARAGEQLVPLLDFGRTDEGRLFVVMMSPEGDSLREALDREVQLAVPRVIDILQQIAEALRGSHESGWIHGDLRPKNVRLVPLGSAGATGTGATRGGGKDIVRLLDFGLAQLLSGAQSGAASPRLTYGDPHYMAPEQALGEAVDGRADLHALGVLGYEMLVGELPFAGAHPGETLERLLSTQRPSARARRPECPEWLDALLQRAMARRPEERLSSVTQLLGYLGRGGEATPVELVAERARSGVAPGGEATVRREPVSGAAPLVGDPVIVQPEGGPVSGASVVALAESESAM
ncbi:MAG TPA: serine/threonine-protein kinase, partial [Polyangia bacterium]|nr:serine/threonine-protein kinase [Polyangia bacterium]